MAMMLMGAFENPAHADQALRKLEERGYMPEEVSVISHNASFNEEHAGSTDGSDIAKATGTGAVTGGVIGGLAGLLAGAGLIPALAGLFIGGPIAAAIGLTGAAAATASGAMTGIAAGGLVGALTGLGLSKEMATSYDDIVNRGGVVLGLTGHDEITTEARAILEQCGARDINVGEMRSVSKEIEADDEVTEAGPAGARQPVFGERREAGREYRNEDD